MINFVIKRLAKYVIILENILELIKDLEIIIEIIDIRSTIKVVKIEGVDKYIDIILI